MLKDGHLLSLGSPEIVRQYAGREQKLWAKLHKKYGITATSTASTASSGDSSKPVKHKMQSSEKPAVYDAAFKAYPLKLGSDSDPLDLRSSAFDTLQALKTGDKAVALLVQGTFPLDNIQKCRHLVRPWRSVLSLSIIRSRLFSLSVCSCQRRISTTRSA